MSGRVHSDVHVPVCGQDGQGKARKGKEGQKHTDNVKGVMGNEGSNSMGHKTGRKTADDDEPARKTRTTISTSTN